MGVQRLLMPASGRVIGKAIRFRAVRAADESATTITAATLRALGVLPAETVTVFCVLVQPGQIAYTMPIRWTTA